MVMYGPLTKDFRVARFINKIFFGTFNGEYAIAEAFGRILTDPRYSARVLDKAKELAEMGLMSQQEAFRKSFGATLLTIAGFKEYDQASDPERLLLDQAGRDARQMAIAVESEEGLGATPNQQ